MKVKRDISRMEYFIRFDERELYHAFSSKERFYSFIRAMLIYTVGEEKANDLFHIIEESGEEHDS